MRWSSADPAARRSAVKRSSFALLFGLLLASAVLFASGRGNGANAEAESYSPYADPDKPVLSTVLAGEANVAAFRERFGLTQDEIDEVLAALREENRALEKEYAQSEELLGDDAGGPSDAEGRKKVEASDYDERLREIIAETKAKVEGVLPPGSRGELAAWSDERFSRDAAAVAEGISDGGAATRTATRATSRGETCRVWTTYYRGYTNYEVAVPHQAVKFAGGYRVRIRPTNRPAEWAPVKEVGPWNVRDNYWQPRKLRDRFADLPRCVPEAAAAYYWDYRNGEDGYGRQVTNPAGLDMTIAVAKRLGIAGQLQRYGKVRVNVYYSWAR